MVSGCASTPSRSGRSVDGRLSSARRHPYSTVQKTLEASIIAGAPAAPTGGSGAGPDIRRPSRRAIPDTWRSSTDGLTIVPRSPALWVWAAKKVQRRLRSPPSLAGVAPVLAISLASLHLRFLDRQSGEVWLSVDRGGVGEIAWWEPRAGCIVATSDLGLLQALSGPLPVDRESAFLQLNSADPAPGRSICLGVGQLPPDYAGHSRGNWPSLVKYPSKTIDTADILFKFDDAVDAMAAALRTAAKDRLRSGPGALLLSGGVDSGTAAAAARDSTGPGLLSAIAFSSKLPGVDEQASSKPLADRLGLEHFALNVDEWAPYSCDNGSRSWADRFGAPGPFDPFRLPFGEAIEASYALAAKLGASVVWGGDRGDLVIGEGTHSALRPLLTGIIRRDRRLAQIGVLDLRADYQHRGARCLIDHLRPLMSRLRPQAQPHSRPIQIFREPSTPMPPPSAPIADPLARRWAWWRSPFVDRIFRASSFLARRHGLRITDPWSDMRVISVSCSISQTLLNPPGNANKQLGRQVARNLLDGWQPQFCRNGIEELWLYGTRGPGASTIRDLAAEPKLECAGIDSNLLQRATESYVSGALKYSGFLSPAWNMAWWFRAYC